MSFAAASSGPQPLIRPNRQLIPVRVLKLKPAASGEREDFLGDLRSGALDRHPHRFQIRGVDHDQRPALARGLLNLGKAAGKPSITERRVVRTIVGKLLAERARVEALSRFDIGRSKFHVVDAAVLFGLAHERECSEPLD